MKRPGLFTLLGLVTLVGALGAASWRLARHGWDRGPGERITLRFAHWQLEGGIREGFDALARDYEALHPDVRIEQIAIPMSAYGGWGITHIIGGDPPDLMELGKGIVDERFYRYFTPITEEIEAPNPYNAGTALRRVPWRKTFADGMESTYNPQSFDCYGASILASTTRIYFNEALMKEITGQALPPVPSRR